MKYLQIRKCGVATYKIKTTLILQLEGKITMKHIAKRFPNFSSSTYIFSHVSEKQMILKLGYTL